MHSTLRLEIISLNTCAPYVAFYKLRHKDGKCLVCDAYRCVGLDCIEQCFTSPPTQYRLYGRRFLQVTRTNQQRRIGNIVQGYV